MGVWKAAAAALVFMSVSGCLGGSDDGAGGTVTFEETTLDGLTLRLTFENATAIVGASFNMTLSALVESVDDNATMHEAGDSNATDASNMTVEGPTFDDAHWILTITPVMGNATAGNGTADGNITEPARFEGVGLPATLAHTFAANGTHLVQAVVHASGFEEAVVETSIDVHDVAETVGEVLPDYGPRPEAPYLLDDADGNTVAWTHSAADTFMGNWHQSDAEAQSGSQSWAATIEPLHIYGDAANIWMTSPSFVLTWPSTLTYAAQGGTELDFDYMHVELLVSGDVVTLAQHSGTVSDWETHVHDLSAYIGKEVALQIRFTSDSNCSGMTPVLTLCDDGQLGPGWFIDDMIIEAMP